jgi:hypothetical protein
MTLGDRVAQLYLKALGTHFSRFYDMHGLQWDYSLIPATTPRFVRACSAMDLFIYFTTRDLPQDQTIKNLHLEAVTKHDLSLISY